MIRVELRSRPRRRTTVVCWPCWGRCCGRPTRRLRTCWSWPARASACESLEAELALLVEDSASGDGEPAAQSRAVAVRGAGLAAEPRQLTFHFGG